MNEPAHRFAALVIAGASVASAADDWLDKLDDALTVSAANDSVRLRLSGTIDLEAYALPQPSPGLLFTERYSLFNPRLTLFLDEQLGPHVYAFAQVRVDQGFDPGSRDARLALDEYAIRFTPWDDGRFNLQIGKFATVVGNWAPRHGSWENPFITAPLPYENLTGIWDSSAADSVGTVRGWAGLDAPAGSVSRTDALAGKRLRNPVIWGSSYTSGVAAFGKIGKFEYAAEFKNASLSSRPESWDATAVQWQHPTVSGRIGVRPNVNWRLGASASVGPYLDKRAVDTIPPGSRMGDYREIVVGQDVSFAWHHWQLWAEVFESRFEIPGVGNADSLAYYLEAKYKFTAQLFGAVRWNQHVFSTLPDGNGGREVWSGDIWRSDFALGYRFTAHTQLKLQYSLDRHATDGGGFGHTFAAQFTIRF